MRRKGEMSPAALDRLFPHQVALQALDYREQFERAPDHSLPRGTVEKS